MKMTKVAREERIIDAIVQWLKDKAVETKAKGFVVGVSGGIDSAVTSTLVAKTELPTTVVQMHISQHDSEVNRAQIHIKGLKRNFGNVANVDLNLTPAYGCFTLASDSAIGESSNAPESRQNLARANLRSRLRMAALYYYANLNEYLVVGTGNKVEDFGVGFFTKYGDGGVDLSPIADLMKSEVYKVAEHLNISKEIIEARPTDGLWDDGRTDEEQIGCTYDELEWAMKYLEHDEKDDLTPRQSEVLKIYLERHEATRHKTQTIPVCEINF